MSVPIAARAAPTESGPPVVGDGLGDGVGAALGRFFFRMPALLGEKTLEVHVTSNETNAEPVCLSAGAEAACSEPGEGAASVAGYPAAFFGTVTQLKLAASVHLPRGARGPDGESLRGHSLELALEGGLYAGPKSPAGATADLRLARSRPDRLLAWGREDPGSGSTRRYDTETGTGLVIGDDLLLVFAGWLRGEVAEQGPDAFLVRFRGAELEQATDPVTHDGFDVLPDFAAAAAAGLPPGVFGVLEVNHSGFGTPSRIHPGAASNDVEVVIPAVPVPSPFVRADCDGDLFAPGSIVDAVFLLNFNFAGGEDPPCLAACDADGDGVVRGMVTDAVYMLQYSFRGGPAPPDPFPECGSDPGSDLSCDTPPGCEE
jgi:hypothetical protein